MTETATKTDDENEKEAARGVFTPAQQAELDALLAGLQPSG